MLRSYHFQATDGSIYFWVSSKKAKKALDTTQAIPAKSTKPIYNAPASWKKLSQPSVASQGAAVEKLDKAAAPAAAKNTKKKKSDEANVLKLQAKTVADFRNLQNLLVTQDYAFHTYSLKQEREIRVFLRGVPREIRIEEVKEDLRSQSLPVQSVRRILIRYRYNLDLVLVSGTAKANDKATKADFFKIKSVCSLSGIKMEQSHKHALPGHCYNYYTDTRPSIALIPRDGLNVWETTSRTYVASCPVVFTSGIRP
ncbi:hypothetical protein EVAR_53517_1 [Eumeta japonica]|uniref:Pre-C2HC domain-containing protein n=1 Tax=Eumeta variegata TaxID=151549 RepID=A0A4C1Y686_EUMVA|nr:hypothetical protein EVAR_53517_1 [Eumeta japonica]